MKIEPHLIVIFGATGDLARRKLIPALARLLRRGELSGQTPIVCLGRRPLSREAFWEHLGQGGFLADEDEELLDRLEGLVQYRQFDLDTGTADELAALLNDLDRQFCRTGNMLFYLALPTGSFPAVTELLQPLNRGAGWKRVVFEKPFGEDLASARELQQAVSSRFREERIFRVDHYLGKELVQNILFLRFANEIFCCSWKHDAIDNVQITVSETLGVEDRAGYYDRSGAIRDMVQNHLLQLLSFTAMEPPADGSSDAIRDQAARVIERLRPPKREDVVVGQYRPGVMDGGQVSGYTGEHGVAPDSGTETFVALRAFVDTPRWQGVPFYLRTGKRMARRYAEIRVIFKRRRCDRLFRNDKANMIVIRIQPDEGIALAFNVRKPGAEHETESVLMDFCHSCHFGPNTPEAYEAIMASVMRGDPLLFTRWDWLEASWRFTDRLRAVMGPVVGYDPGSTGPEEAGQLPRADGRSWVEATEHTQSGIALASNGRLRIPVSLGR